MPLTNQFTIHYDIYRREIIPNIEERGNMETKNITGMLMLVALVAVGVFLAEWLRPKLTT